VLPAKAAAEKTIGRELRSKIMSRRKRSGLLWLKSAQRFLSAAIQ